MTDTYVYNGVIDTSSNYSHTENVDFETEVCVCSFAKLEKVC